MYVICRKGEDGESDQYFKALSYVNSSGLVDEYEWVSNKNLAFGTSLKDLAESICARYGGEVQDF